MERLSHSLVVLCVKCFRGGRGRETLKLAPVVVVQAGWPFRRSRRAGPSGGGLAQSSIKLREESCTNTEQCERLVPVCMSGCEVWCGVA